MGKESEAVELTIILNDLIYTSDVKNLYVNNLFHSTTSISEICSKFVLKSFREVCVNDVFGEHIDAQVYLQEYKQETFPEKDKLILILPKIDENSSLKIKKEELLILYVYSKLIKFKNLQEFKYCVTENSCQFDILFKDGKIISITGTVLVKNLDKFRIEFQ